MGEKIKIHGYPEFKSKAAAIRALIKDGKTTKEIKQKIPYITEQNIFDAKKRMT